MIMLDRVQKIIEAIPSGRVTTYGEVGRVLGINPRQIGRLLHQNDNPEKFPCHRVVRSNGTLASGYAFGGKEEQRRILELEGISFRGEFIVNFKSRIFRTSEIDCSA